MNKKQSNTKELAARYISVGTADFAQTLMLVTLAILAPVAFAHAPQNQLITGTIVNALLFYGAWRLGLLNALLIAIIPSTVALVQGILPAPFALMIPYIIAANCLLVVVFSALKNSLMIGIVTASIFKFSLLFLVAGLFASKIGTGVLAMFQWTQLLTSLLGGLVAFSVIKLKK